MCEANAYLVKKNQEELFMESVDIVEPDPDGNDAWRLVDIFGNQKMVKGRIKGMRLVDHKLFFEVITL